MNPINGKGAAACEAEAPQSPDQELLVIAPGEGANRSLAHPRTKCNRLVACQVAPESRRQTGLIGGTP
jgi:hypothetical protein